MTYVPTDAGLADDISVKQLLQPIADLMALEGVTEICINEPGWVHFEQNATWHDVPRPEITFQLCKSLATAVGVLTEQTINEVDTVLSATLRSGERIHVILPPTCPSGTVSITVRIPSPSNRSLQKFEDEGFFSLGATHATQVSRGDRELSALKEQGRFREFLLGCVRERKNIGIVGDTGSGKTTFMKSLCQEIPPGERLITIEDTRELFLERHRNKVHLVYSTHGKARIDAAGLIKSTLRMKPDRVLPAELRGAEAFDFVDLLTTGHKGSITSWHAESALVAFERFALMCKKHPSAASYTHAELMRLLHMNIDVIAHVQRSGQQRFISDIYFEPQRKHTLRHGPDCLPPAPPA